MAGEGEADGESGIVKGRSIKSGENHEMRAGRYGARWTPTNGPCREKPPMRPQ